jgi:hypothetical protein
MSQVMAAFRERFKMPLPRRSTLLDWEKRAFALGSVKARPRTFWVYGDFSANLFIIPNKMHLSQSLFYPTTLLDVSGITITHLQEHKTTVTTASGNHYTVIGKVTPLQAWLWPRGE